MNRTIRQVRYFGYALEAIRMMSSNTTAVPMFCSWCYRPLGKQFRHDLTGRLMCIECAPEINQQDKAALEAIVAEASKHGADPTKE